MQMILLNFFLKKPNVLKWASRILNFLAFVALSMWLMNRKIEFNNQVIDQEAFFVLLTTTAVIFNQFHRNILKEVEFSPAYALALGYVNNFLEPVIIQLLENGIKSPLIYIYRPKSLSELYQNNIDKTKAIIKNKDLNLQEFQLNLKHGRARDVLTIKKSKTKQIYFDFPNTLLSLTAYIDYKIGSKTKDSSKNEKEELSNKLIVKFYEKVNSLLEEKQLDHYIRYCDSELKFQF